MLVCLDSIPGDEIEKYFVDVELECSGQVEGEDVVGVYRLDYSLNKLNS